MKQSQNTLVALNFYVNYAGNHTESFFNYNGGIASSRIQLKPALMAASEIGLSNEVWSLHSTKPEDLYKISKANICIIGKLNSDSTEGLHNLAISNVAAVAHLKRKGAAILLLYSDHHLVRGGVLKELYMDLAYMSDTIICPTQMLKNQVLESIPQPKPTIVIEDPWSLAKCSYCSNSEKSLEIAWFGSGLNIPYLARELPNIFSSELIKIPITLKILSSKAGLSRLKEFLSFIKFDKSKYLIKYIEWSHTKQPAQLENLLINSDIALIPSDPKDPRKMGVSHNRLVDASRCGCIPIASPMESYKELSKISLIGNDFPKMINFAWDNKARLQQKYEAHRDSLLNRFSPEENKKKWKDVIQNFI